MTIKAETKEMPLQAEGHQRLPAKHQKLADSMHQSLSAFRRNLFCQQQILNLQSPDHDIIKLYCLSPQFVVLCYGSRLI